MLISGVMNEMLRMKWKNCIRLKSMTMLSNINVSVIWLDDIQIFYLTEEYTFLVF